VSVRSSAVLYLSQRPAPPLDDFVEYLWLLSDAPAHARERVVPSGTLELVVNLHEDEIRIYDRDRAGGCDRFSGMVVSGAYGRCFTIDTAEHALIMGAHFRPGGAYPFFSVALNRLADDHVDVRDLWGARAVDLRERLASAGSHAARFRLLEETLRAQTVRPLRGRSAVQYAIDRFLRPGARIADVAAGIGISHRRLIELFAAEVGMTPKLFCRVHRFQRLLAAMNGGARDWAGLAARAGYFDQSHLIRDFSTFAGVTPQRYCQRPPGRVKENHVAVAEG